jgi:hypothetical protein
MTSTGMPDFGLTDIYKAVISDTGSGLSSGSKETDSCGAAENISSS